MSEARSFTAHRHDYSHSWEVRPFDPSEDRSLRRYWTGGLSVAGIAQKLGRTKSSIVGRAHRLKLTPRPSPIQRGPKPEAHHSATKAADSPPSVPPAPTPLPSPPASPPTDQVPEQLPPAVRPNLTPPAAFPTFRTCQYPRGTRPHWDWCGAPTAPGMPYCHVHVGICYQRLPRWAEAAA